MLKWLSLMWSPLLSIFHQILKHRRYMSSTLIKNTTHKACCGRCCQPVRHTAHPNTADWSARNRLLDFSSIASRLFTSNLNNSISQCCVKSTNRYANYSLVLLTRHSRHRRQKSCFCKLPSWATVSSWVPAAQHIMYTQQKHGRNIISTMYLKAEYRPCLLRKLSVIHPSIQICCDRSSPMAVG